MVMMMMMMMMMMIKMIKINEVAANGVTMSTELDPQYIAELRQKPEEMVKLVQHHAVPGRVQTSDLLGDSEIASVAPMGVMLKVNVDRQVSGYW